MGSIYDVRCVHRLFFIRAKFLLSLDRDTCRHSKPHEPVNRPHLLRVPAGQIFVDRHQNGALPRQGIQVKRKRGHQSLPFPGVHLRQTALMHGNSSQHLYVKGSLAQNAVIRLTDRRKRLRQDVVQRLPAGQTLFEFFRQMGQLLIGKLLHPLLVAPDLF